MADGPLRVALLVYRGNPHSGGQGVYTRYLSRELVELGHQVTVFAGQPWPSLDDGVDFVPFPSLDLYRQPDPFRRPKRAEFRDWIDAAEFGLMCTAGFPEPRTFSLRVRRQLAARRGCSTWCTTTSPSAGACSGSWPTAGRCSAPAPPDHRRPGARPGARRDLRPRSCRCAAGTGSSACRSAWPARCRGSSRCPSRPSGTSSPRWGCPPTSSRWCRSAPTTTASGPCRTSPGSRAGS